MVFPHWNFRGSVWSLFCVGQKERPPDLRNDPGAQVTLASPGIFWGAVGADPRLAVGLLQICKGAIPDPYGGSGFGQGILTDRIRAERKGDRVQSRGEHRNALAAVLSQPGLLKRIRFLP